MSSPGVRDSDPLPEEDATGAGAARGPGADAAATIAVAAVASCLIALIAALVAGGAVTARVIPGLPDAGPLTRWGLPVSTTVRDVAAALTIGLLLLALFLLPLRKGALGPQALAYVRAAAWPALVWAGAGGAALIFQLSDVSGLPPAEIIGDQLTSYAVSVAQGIGLLVVILLACTVALLCRTTETAAGAFVPLVLSGAALVPPALTGHSASSGSHELAITGLALHIVAVSVWVGGLAAVTFHGLRAKPDSAAVAAERFSRMALWTYIGVGAGGIASAVSRLYSVSELFTTPYGVLILIKALLFIGLGAVGWAHRRYTIPRIARIGGRRLFARLAGVEIAVMSATMGIAAALSRTAPPEQEGTVGTAQSILGFPMPPPITAESLLTLWRPDLFFVLVVVLLGGGYAAGVVRLVRRGDTWPWARTAVWAVGLLVLAAMLLSGVATYSKVLFSVHMVQHMTLSMLVPILLVLGAPITLALRALRPAHQRGDRGPREWLTAFINSRFARVATHPALVMPLFVLSPYALYFTPLFATLMNDHTGHLFMNVHFLLSGFLYYWIIVGVDPGTRKIPYLLRIVLLLAAIGVHAFFGIAIMMQSAPLAMDYYGQFEVPWIEGQAADQNTGGGIAWAVGEIPTGLVLLVLVGQWRRDEERAERRRERHSRRGGSDDADMDAYNEYLAELDRRSKEPPR